MEAYDAAGKEAAYVGRRAESAREVDWPESQLQIMSLV
jgi:hypothetical protein